MRRIVKRSEKILHVLCITLIISIMMFTSILTSKSIHDVINTTNIPFEEYIEKILHESYINNCTIVKAKDYFQRSIVITLKCRIVIPSLLQLNCTYNGQNVICSYTNKFLLIKSGEYSYDGFTIYIFEVHRRTINNIISHPAISLIRLMSCSTPNICSITVFSLSNIKNIILITPKKFNIIYCEGLNIVKKINMDNHMIYILTVKPNIKIMYSSRGIFYSKCAIITTSPNTQKLSLMLIGIVLALVCGLFALSIYTIFISRCH